MELLKEKVQLQTVEKIYSLVFLLASEKNFKKAVDYIKDKKFKKLCEMPDGLPSDFDEKDYPIIDVIYVKGHDTQYIAIVLNDDNGRAVSLRYFSETSSIDLASCSRRGLIYPI